MHWAEHAYPQQAEIPDQTTCVFVVGEPAHLPPATHDHVQRATAVASLLLNHP